MEGLLDGHGLITDGDHDYYFGFNNGVGYGKRKVKIP